MAGLIQSQMGAPAAPQGAVAGATHGSITPQSIMSHLHLNPQQAQQVNRIVVAGMKVMFSPQSHQMMVKQLSGPGPMPQKLGEGIAGLMGILVKESNNALPAQLIIPAGMVLLAHAADFLAKSNQHLSDQDVGAAIQVFVTSAMQAAKLDPNKVVAAAQKYKASKAGGPGAAGAPPMPGAGAAQPPQGV